MQSDTHELPTSEEIRRRYLLAGGDAAATAKALGVSRETLYRHLRKAKAQAPLSVRASFTAMRRSGQARGVVDDRAAVEAFVRAQLARVGVEAL